MKIRNSAKAIIIRDNKLLVAKMQDDSGIYYLLPGGGQEAGEKLQSCLIRECIEETGWLIEVKELLYVRECFADKDIHRVEFMFRGEAVRPMQATGMDANQLGTEWVELDEILDAPLYPRELRAIIASYRIGHAGPTYLGEIQ